ncbi:hypothetical protein B0H11DRAFT_2262170 [Mycena galericulata]|nr:hypothetical protein B0H11DRAFT_2262170 [Mycena galericulata]
MPPAYDVLHSGSWWKDFHENRARAHALAQSKAARNPLEESIDFHPQPPAFTFIPGRSGVPTIPTTATHGLPPSKALARYKKRMGPARDPDAELLARLAESRERQKKREERKAAATQAQRKVVAQKHVARKASRSSGV